jgi:hypothetical protein
MMFEHRQAFAAMKLHGEFGGQSVKARLGFQAVDDSRRQRPGVDHVLRVDAGAGAEHDVAHIVAGRLARSQARFQQALDQSLLLITDAANLQIGAVGRFDDAVGITLGRGGHRVGLVCTQLAACQLDPTDAAIQGLDDTQQPRTCRGADNIARLAQKGTGHTRKTTGMDKARYYACFVRRHEKSARRNSFV